MLGVIRIGRRNGKIRLLSNVKRGLLFAAFSYTKRGNFIRNPVVLKALNPILDYLKDDKTEVLAGSSNYGIGVQATRGSDIKRVSRSETDNRYFPMRLKEYVYRCLNKLSRSPEIKREVNPLNIHILRLLVKIPVEASSNLLSAATRVVREVMEAMSPKLRLMRTGLTHAWKNSQLAQLWGHKDALRWRDDPAYSLYWGATIMNWPKAFDTPT